QTDVKHAIPPEHAALMTVLCIQKLLCIANDAFDPSPLNSPAGTSFGSCTAGASGCPDAAHHAGAAGLPLVRKVQRRDRAGLAAQCRRRARSASPGRHYAAAAGGRSET